MKRENFLKEFLGALGAKDVIINRTEEKHVYGTAVFDLNDPSENQDFCWHIIESKTPQREVYNLICLIREQRLLSLDQIVITRGELRKRYNERWSTQLSPEDFTPIIDSLEDIEVSMVNDGKEFDAFFIHE